MRNCSTGIGDILGMFQDSEFMECNLTISDLDNNFQSDSDLDDPNAFKIPDGLLP